jgi:hypothetical protein
VRKSERKKTANIYLQFIASFDRQMITALLVITLTTFHNDAEEATNKVLDMYNVVEGTQTDESKETNPKASVWSLGDTWHLWDWLPSAIKDAPSIPRFVFTETQWPESSQVSSGFWTEAVWFLVIGALMFLCIRFWVFGTVAKIWSALMSVVAFAVVLSKVYYYSH